MSEETKTYERPDGKGGWAKFVLLSNYESAHATIKRLTEERDTWKQLHATLAVEQSKTREKYLTQKGLAKIYGTDIDRLQSQLRLCEEHAGTMANDFDVSLSVVQQSLSTALARVEETKDDAALLELIEAKGGQLTKRAGAQTESNYGIFWEWELGDDLFTGPTFRAVVAAAMTQA